MTIVRVFLASPSDLHDERTAAPEVVTQANAMLREVDCILELCVWQDRSPGFGRPQDQINEDVDRCDLFVGIVSHRWGSPTGEYSSGFEEEFERAVSRRRESGSPEIFLYFKHLDDPSDPGDQMRRVLAFRERIEMERELLYMEFRDTAEWRTSFLQDLVKFILKRVQQQHVSSTLSTAIATVPAATGGPPRTRPLGTAVEVQEPLYRLSVALAEAVAAPGAQQLDRRLFAIGDADVVRLQFLGAAVVYETLSHDILSNHAANLVYKHRGALGTLSGAERRLVLASLLREGNRYVPGWYWVTDVANGGVPSLLGTLAVEHPDPKVRTSTMQMLSSRPYLQGITRTQVLVASVLDQPSEEIRKAGLDYADRFGDAETAEVIKSRLPEMPDELARLANLVVDRIVARLDPVSALDRMLETDDAPDGGPLSVIEKATPTLDAARLRRMLVHKSYRFRLMAADALTRQDVLTAEEARILLTDSETRLRAIGIRRLIALGERPTTIEIRKLLDDAPNTQSTSLLALAFGTHDAPSANELVEALFSTFSYDELIRRVKWHTVDGGEAYKVLGLMHFERFEHRLRKDLADGFAAFHESEKESMREAATTVILDKWADLNLDDFIRSGFVRAALAALAKNGSTDDLSIARQHLNSEDRASSEASLDIVSSFGDDTDFDELVDLAARALGDVAERAANAALALSTDGWGRAKQYVEKGEKPFLQVGIDALNSHSKLASSWRELVPYLSFDSADVRLATVNLLCRHLEAVELNELLNQYLEAETYYYDVVTVLDRSIYGPESWRSV